MRSAPTLKSWMTPFSSVAMIEKLALVRIAFCSAPALRSAVVRPRSGVLPVFQASPGRSGPLAASVMAAFVSVAIAVSRCDCRGQCRALLPGHARACAADEHPPSRPIRPCVAPHWAGTAPPDALSSRAVRRPAGGTRRGRGPPWRSRPGARRAAGPRHPTASRRRAAR